MSQLIVYLNDEKVGILEQDSNDLLHFSYDALWLDRKRAIPLSRSLPLQEDAISNRVVRSFFAGILPEAEPRSQIARILGISEENDFAMLARIGGECAGAVSLYPENEESGQQESQDLRKLSETELETILNELPQRPLMAGTEGVRLSLAGAQHKLPVIVKEDGVYLPCTHSSTTHILKPEPSRFPGLVTNELFCMQLARTTGLPVPETEAFQVGALTCLLVTRYDRRRDESGMITRIHQEDFCQALGLPPERKYQVEGGPTVRDSIALLRKWSTAPVRDIPIFIDGLIFNVLIGNADAHGKNYSLLYSGGERRLAPFYDLVSTLAWENLSKTAAMKIGGSDSITAFVPGDWKRLATRSGLAWPMLRERIGVVSQAVLKGLDDVRGRMEASDSATTERLAGIIAQRAARMLDQLSKESR